MVAAMVNYLDSAVGQLIDSLKAKDMYDNTLIVFSADNGGAIYYPAGGNNNPLLGGKYGVILYFYFLSVTSIV